MKKVIDIPNPVTVETQKLVKGEVVTGKEDVTFLEFLEYCLDGYEELAKTPKMIRQYDQIMTVIESMNGEKSICFGTDDFAVVKAAVESRNWRTPKLGRSYLPFYKAVDEVQEVKETGKD